MNELTEIIHKKYITMMREKRLSIKEGKSRQQIRNQLDILFKTRQDFKDFLASKHSQKELEEFAFSNHYFF